MNHTTAVEQHAVERYLLGELSAEEQDAFEQHFFECAVCAEGVRDGDAMIAGIRHVGGELPAAAPATGWFTRLFASPAFAGALLVALLAQTAYLYIGRERAKPETVIAYALHPAARGSAPSIAAGKSAVLMLDLPPGTTGDLNITLQPGTWSTTATAPQDGEPLAVYLPASQLTPGSLSVEIRTSNQQLVASFPIEVK